MYLDPIIFARSLFGFTEVRGNTCVQFFASDKDYVGVYCMKKEAEYLYALKEFSKEVGGLTSSSVMDLRLKTRVQ